MTVIFNFSEYEKISICFLDLEICMIEIMNLG